MPTIARVPPLEGLLPQVGEQPPLDGGRPPTLPEGLAFLQVMVDL